MSESAQSPTPSPVAFVLKGYPRLSETFIAQEIAALEARGLDILIVSLRHPTDRKRHALHDQIRARILYLPEYLYQEPLRVLRGWWFARHLPGYRRALQVWWQDFKRDRSSNRIRRFGQAMVLAAELPAGYRHLHAHFIHTPGSVARYAAQILQCPWTASAHARDIWITPDWEKREKLADCQWVVTCTAHNRTHLAALSDSERVSLVYHGIDFSRFPEPPVWRARRDGRDAQDPVRLLSVGRAVDKKGYDILLRALARLPVDLHWHFTHIGGGPLLAKLKAQAVSLGIADRISWQGSATQEAVIEAYRTADVFALASRRDQDGDMDGLPNVLMEAQSQALPCVATTISAIPELIVDGETGLLVPSEDVGELVVALNHVIVDPALRERLGKAASARVRQAFEMTSGIAELARRFGLAA
ncbi:glycosyltransferase family 4 protein [Ferrovibrio terrae]|uniref:Glycosyltransferase family 4 protein n=1 Tax=Ferrovibrio terrae TaxID=2594003 RepID=A0A516H6R3_9PROT|nr:glycosyltransferase family 4 protein [Ferrovibrio terrae]QDO99459.1 glycosyltransferase family 4 protein [Ferrovibrio terrae]